MSPSIVRAPVRISFGGGGTDLSAYYSAFDGFVVSTAITRYCYVMARRPQDGSIRINSADYRKWQAFEPGVIPHVREPLSLAKAAIEYFASRGLRELGVDLFLSSEVPPGTGLGSSSAMAVALVRALAAYLSMPMEAPEVAELASWLEIERLAMPIGKQDQYASAFGGVNAIEFRTAGVDVQPLSLPAQVSEVLNSRLLLFLTGRSRHSAKILRKQRTDTAVNRQVTESLHRLKSLAEDMRIALLENRLDDFGGLLDVGWQLKKHLSGKISSPEIDKWYAEARGAGALGGKITGAGGGGFLLLYCPQRRQAGIRKAMTRCGLSEMTFDFDYSGAIELASEGDAAVEWPVPKIVSEQVLSSKRQRRLRQSMPSDNSEPLKQEKASHA